jgi:hypothetical protein
MWVSPCCDVAAAVATEMSFVAVGVLTTVVIAERDSLLLFLDRHHAFRQQIDYSIGRLVVAETGAVVVVDVVVVVETTTRRRTRAMEVPVL